MRERGVTLVELLVSVTILALATIVVILCRPGISSLWNAAMPVRMPQRQLATGPPRPSPPAIAAGQRSPAPRPDPSSRP